MMTNQPLPNKCKSKPSKFPKPGEKNNNAVSIGIDLGTTYSSVAYEDMQSSSIPRIISPPEQSNAYVPSVVYWGDHSIEVGTNTIGKEPNRVIIDNKRFIGLKYEKLNSLELEKYPYTISKDKNGEVVYILDPEDANIAPSHITPVNVATEILSYIKTNVIEERVDTNLDKYYVITHPSYFTSSQKHATIDAGMYVLFVLTIFCRYFHILIDINMLRICVNIFNIIIYGLHQCCLW